MIQNLILIVISLRFRNVDISTSINGMRNGYPPQELIHHVNVGINFTRKDDVRPRRSYFPVLYRGALSAVALQIDILLYKLVSNFVVALFFSTIVSTEYHIYNALTNCGNQGHVFLLRFLLLLNSQRLFKRRLSKILRLTDGVSQIYVYLFLCPGTATIFNNFSIVSWTLTQNLIQSGRAAGGCDVPFKIGTLFGS